MTEKKVSQSVVATQTEMRHLEGKNKVPLISHGIYLHVCLCVYNFLQEKDK